MIRESEMAEGRREIDGGQRKVSEGDSDINTGLGLTGYWNQTGM